MIVDKKVTLTLAGLDGNIYSLIAAFRRQARREGWTPTEIDDVTVEAESGNYSHAVATLMDHCEGGGLGSDDDG